jgi:hypothetical protein
MDGMFFSVVIFHQNVWLGFLKSAIVTGTVGLLRLITV